jgi:hypothetical protein
MLHPDLRQIITNLQSSIVALTARITEIDGGNTGTGFYGNFTITNRPSEGSTPKYIQVRLGYKIPVPGGDYILGDISTGFITINSGDSYTFTILASGRLSSPDTLLVLKLIAESGLLGISAGTDDPDVPLVGATVVGGSEEPLDTENYIDFLLNSDNINNGVLDLVLILYTDN